MGESSGKKPALREKKASHGTNAKKGGQKGKKWGFEKTHAAGRGKENRLKKIKKVKEGPWEGLRHQRKDHRHIIRFKENSIGEPAKKKRGGEKEGSKPNSLGLVLEWWEHNGTFTVKGKQVGVV